MFLGLLPQGKDEGPPEEISFANPGFLVRSTGKRSMKTNEIVEILCENEQVKAECLNAISLFVCSWAQRAAPESSFAAEIRHLSYSIEAG